MRDADTILGIIRDRGSRGLPLEGVYRQLFNPALYLAAYGKLYRNQGAMTPGATAETVDGMSQEKIRAIIDAVRHERYRWTPARRVYVEKQGSTKRRPLGVPTWSDKLLHEVVRLLLEADYEPQFSARSHGFRPGRGCHTALREIYRTWTGTAWFIEGDIAAYFDSIDHQVLLAILRERLHDNRFLRLIENLLKAGYLEGWTLHQTLSGTPQGGIVSPILANIYLDRLDRFVECTLIPAYTRGCRRGSNPAHRRVATAVSRARRHGDREQAKALARHAKTLPTLDPRDPDYRRLRYIRYADDFLLGFIGPRAEAEAIKRRLGEFLRDTLKLALSDAKTRLTHATTGSARFLGYDLSITRDNRLRDAQGRRALNGQVTLRVPAEVIQAKCKPYMAHGKPIHRPERTHDAVFSTVAGYQAECRGVVEYYRLAINLRDFGKLLWIAETSLTKTLGCKLRLSVPKVYRRFRATIATPHGPRKVLRVEEPRDGKRPLVAIWGGIDLRRNVQAALNDTPPRVWNTRSELVQRLLADTCELCGSQDRIEVHHIRALRDLHRWGRAAPPAWVRTMAARQRKTLVLCATCHRGIKHRAGTAGDVAARRTRTRASGEPDAVKVARPVPRGAEGKVAAG